MSRLRVLFALLTALAHVPLARAQSYMCSREECDCNPAAHPSWVAINCTVPENQDLDMIDGDVPGKATDINITGGASVTFGVNSLSRLNDARNLQVIGAKIIVVRQYAAVNLKTVSLFMDVQDCQLFRIEKKAFTNLEGPLSATITNCDVVSIESDAFSWLLSMEITNVRELQLEPGTFMLEPSASNIGLHGPGLMIEMINVTIPEFPSQTFGSSAAAIDLRDSTVRHIRPDAFNANTYNRFAAYNTTFGRIHQDAFSQKSLIHKLHMENCSVGRVASGAVQSAISLLNFTFTTFDSMESGAINITVASVYIVDSKFINFAERSFEFTSWSKIFMRRNCWDELPENAIIAPGSAIYELIFVDNDIEKIAQNSLGFIGKTWRIASHNVVYNNNYYGQSCHCNISGWLAAAFDTNVEYPFQAQSYCTVDEFFARCFNVPEQNMVAAKFLASVCNGDNSINCESFKTKTDGESTEIKNPRFPHKKEYKGLSDRNKKVIGIVIVSALGCALLALLISLIRWMKRRGYCLILKNLIVSLQSSCCDLCYRICSCANTRGIDNVRSGTHLSVYEYSERRRLNETRLDMIQENAIPNVYTADNVTMVDKMIQTMPEELTKELLENLRDRLDDPDNYKEAREMIEHLYELIKGEETCHFNTPVHQPEEENIYEVPIVNTLPRMGKNNRPVVSVGTSSPSWDRMTPLSPYNRTTALVHEYIEPKDLRDMTAHLYAEINGDNEQESGKRRAGGAPRGPYLKAVREKISSSPSSSNVSSPARRSVSSVPTSSSPSSHIGFTDPTSPDHLSTIKSNKSVKSNGSERMINRPLPAKPIAIDPGEGPSTRC